VIPLPALEGVIDASGLAPQIEDMLPSGARARQLAVRTLLAGMMLALADGRPAHLTRVHQALVSLPEGEQRRLGVLTGWRNGPHRLTYRQAEYTFGLVAAVLGKDEPDGLPSPALQAACDGLPEASVPAGFKKAAARWPSTGATCSPSPGPRRAEPAAAPTPRHRGGTAGTTSPETKMSCSSAITCRTRSRSRTSTARRRPSSPAA
jgi:hypothetical protein